GPRSPPLRHAAPPSTSASSKPPPAPSTSGTSSKPPPAPSTPTHRMQRYKSEWEKKYKWLAPLDEDPYRARCKLCGGEMRADITMIKRHESTMKHQDWEKAAIGSNKSSLTSFVERPNTPLAQKKVQDAELKLAGFLAAHNIAFLAVDHLIPLLKTCFPDSQVCQKMTLSRKKANGILRNVFGAAEKEYMTGILQRPKFSILMDESTDMGPSIKYVRCFWTQMTPTPMSVTVRFQILSDRKGDLKSQKQSDYRTYFMDGPYFIDQDSMHRRQTVQRGRRKNHQLSWDLVQVFSDDDAEGAEVGATAERLFTLVMETFKNVPTGNIVGFGSDGCSVMMGSHNSVASRMRENFPGITIMKCICHSLHLCASQACKHLPRSIEDLVRGIYNYLKSSAKRQALLAQFQRFFDLEVHKILRPSQTRWLSLMAVVERTLEQWDALLLFFQDQVLVARLTSAEWIFETLRNPFMKAYLLFMQWILPKFTGMNEFFQSEQTIITVLDERMRQAYEERLMLYMKDTYVHRRPLKDVDPAEEGGFILLENLFLGRPELNWLATPAFAARPDLVEDFRTRCRSFMVVGCQELRKRSYDFGDTVMQALGALSPAVAMSRQTRPPSILPLASALPRCVAQDDETLQRLEEEWCRFPSLNIAAMKDKELMKVPDRFWHEMRTATDPCGEQLLAHLPSFALSALSLPHSNAGCERDFSKINNGKTKLRNRLVTSQGRIWWGGKGTSAPGAQAPPKKGGKEDKEREKREKEREKTEKRGKEEWTEWERETDGGRRSAPVTSTVRAAVLATQSLRRGPADRCCHSWAPSNDLRRRMTASTVYRTNDADADDALNLNCFED
ncbi:SCAN domain-containing protein 3, partial [Frankliniella fusca]